MECILHRRNSGFENGGLRIYGSQMRLSLNESLLLESNAIRESDLRSVYIYIAARLWKDCCKDLSVSGSKGHAIVLIILTVLWFFSNGEWGRSRSFPLGDSARSIFHAKKVFDTPMLWTTPAFVPQRQNCNCSYSHTSRIRYIRYLANQNSSLLYSPGLFGPNTTGLSHTNLCNVHPAFWCSSQQNQTILVLHALHFFNSLPTRPQYWHHPCPSLSLSCHRSNARLAHTSIHTWIWDLGGAVGIEA